MDTQQGNGLTLEALAQRLEALERENERMRSESKQMRSENAELRHKVATLEDSGTRLNGSAETRGTVPPQSGQPVSVLEGRVSRRSLLSKAGAAAVAAAAAGTLLNPREAKASDGIFDHIWCKGPITTDTLFASTNNPNFAVHGENAGSGPAVEGIANAITGVGVEGTAKGSLGYGVKGTGFSGVWGESDRSGGRGVMGINSSADGTGVKGTTNNTDGHAGVRGEGRIGVLGISPNDRQAGVKGEGSTGVWGVTSKTSYSGVYGEHQGTSGHGTVGVGKGGAAGVLGRNPGGEGVRGEGATGVHGKSTGGIGLMGVTTGDANPGVYGRNLSGYGGQFYGGKAQLKLDPTGSDGHPTFGSHSKGEIHLDKNAQLFVCVKDGTPGTWRMVRTVAT